MAIFRPLVLLGNNTVGELPSGDNVAGQFVLDFIADPASNSNADLYTTITALLAEMRDKGMMLAEEAVLPENVIAPVVTGSNTTPTMLSCDLGTWINSPTSYARQWQLDGVDIPGQTGTNINIGVGEIGDYRCGVTATNAAGTTAPTYSNVITVADEAGGEPGFIGWQGPADDVTPLSDDRVWVYKVVLTETAVLDEFFIYKQTGAGGPEVKGLIFADDGGEPGEFVVGTAMVTCPDGPTWFSIPITGTLPPGTYWIGLVTGGVYTPVGATSSRAGEEIKRAEGYPYPGWNTDWPGTASTVTPRSLAVYVTYTTPVPEGEAPIYRGGAASATFLTENSARVSVDMSSLGTVNAAIVFTAAEATGTFTVSDDEGGNVYTEITDLAGEFVDGCTRVFLCENLTAAGSVDYLVTGPSGSYPWIGVIFLDKNGKTLNVAGRDVVTDDTNPYAGPTVTPGYNNSLALAFIGAGWWETGSAINYTFGDGFTERIETQHQDASGAVATKVLSSNDPVTFGVTSTADEAHALTLVCLSLTD